MAAFEIDDDVNFSANEFDEINNKETKKNLLNGVVLGILTRFLLVFEYDLIQKRYKVFVKKPKPILGN